MEFVRLAGTHGSNVAALCRRFGISRKTGYKWLARHHGGQGVAERSRRPVASPSRTGAEMEAAIVGLRAAHPSWGGRKLRRRLLDLGHTGGHAGGHAGGQAGVPSASTLTAILARHGCIDPAEAQKHAPFTRFEHACPNALWQMDFKGHFATAEGRCHPLTVLDDHSRYAVCVSACANETTATVQDRLVAVFRRFGLPERINVDNGSPWGGMGCGWTPLTVWLRLLGVRTSHSRPHHPQTNGKDERFHRTLKRDVLHGRAYAGLSACQDAFDAFRETYNALRPHEALGLDVPASRYRASVRAYPETLPVVEYDAPDQVRRVQHDGWISFKGHRIHLPKAFAGHPIAIRPTPRDGVWQVVFVANTIGQLDLRQPSPTLKPVTHVPEQV